MKKDSQIDVSICCTTYNHGLYIKEALDGFIMQKTNFNFEILVHDDASTDETVSILKEYKKKYPNLIRLILQKENQFSKDPQSVLEIALKNAKGKYIALCEGDDYWTDKHKLQIQYDYMEKNSKCTLCTHAYDVRQGDNIIERRFPFSRTSNIRIPEFIGRKQMVQTATLFFKKKDILPLPDYYYKSNFGDIPIQLFLTYKGYCHYINKAMSVYRYQSLGSFSYNNSGNLQRKLNNHFITCDIYKNFDEFSDYKYHNEIEEYLLNYNFKFYVSIGNLEEIKQDKYKVLYKNLDIKTKIKIYLKNNKIIYSLYQRVRKFIRR